MLVTVQPLPQPPIAANMTICSGSNASLAVSASGGSYQWYNAAAGGKPLATGPAYYTPPLTATTTYYVESTANGCASARTAVTVTVLPTPAPPTVSGVSVCKGMTATLTASDASGTIQWYNAPFGGNLLVTGGSLSTTALNNDTTFYVQSTLGQCTSTRTPVTVTVIPLTNSGFHYLSGTFCPSSANPTPKIINPTGVFSPQRLQD